MRKVNRRIYSSLAPNRTSTSWLLVRRYSFYIQRVLHNGGTNFCYPLAGNTIMRPIHWLADPQSRAAGYLNSNQGLLQPAIW